MNVDHV
jgi:hypothetical protein